MRADLEATLRAELLCRLFAAQAELQSQISELRRTTDDPALIGACESQPGIVSALQSNVSTASPGALTIMRSEIAATVAAASAMVQQARTSVASSSSESSQLAAITATTSA